MSRLFLILLVVSSSSGSVDAIRTSPQDDVLNEDMEAKATMCKLSENPSSKVKAPGLLYGIKIKFPMSKCSKVRCDVHKIWEKMPKSWLRAREGKGNNICNCYSLPTPGTEEFLFGYTPAKAKNDKCDTPTCWQRYQDLLTITAKALATKRLDGTDFIDSANHWTATCVEEPEKVFLLGLPSVAGMKERLIKESPSTKAGEQGTKILNGRTTPDDETDDDEEEELEEESKAQVDVVTTNDGDTELKIEGIPDPEPVAKVQRMLLDVVITKPVPKNTKAKTTERMVQSVMLSPKKDICSNIAKNDPNIPEYKDSKCGPIKTKETCQQVVNEKLSSTTTIVKAWIPGVDEKPLTRETMERQPKGCYMRRTGTKWHAHWNEYADKEKPARDKNGGNSFEYRLLCGCYRQVPEIVKIEAVEEEVLTPVKEERLCKMYCTQGKACGNSCISSLKACTKEPGTACQATEEVIQKKDEEAKVAVEGSAVHEAMKKEYGGDSEMAACGEHEDNFERAICICKIPNHFTEGADGKLGVTSKEMKAECREQTSHATRWTKYGCNDFSKKASKKSKARKYWCGVQTVSFGFTAVRSGPPNSGSGGAVGANGNSPTSQAASFFLTKEEFPSLG